MDDFNRQFEANAEKQKYSSTGTSLLFNGALAYLFWKYAWASPDGDSLCFAGELGTAVSTEKGEDLTNVTHLFHLWFVIGFVTNCLGIAHAILNFIVPQSLRSVTGPVTVLGFLSLSSSLAFLIWGCVIRWNNAGEVCSGDLYIGNEYEPKPYLWASGYFISLYLTIMLWITGLVCGCCCCIGCCVGVAAS